MKVYIGPYKNWIGPYQITDKIIFWNEELANKFGEWLDTTWVKTFCEWVDSKRKSTIKVRIDQYDTWNMDSTLAYIILPMLKQLQKTKHGAPWVDDDDVPEELRSTNAPPVENNDWDDNVHKRWDYVLNEMIFSFEMKNKCWYNEFYSGQHDVYFEPSGEECENPVSGEKEKLYQMKKGPNDTFKADYEGMRKVEERIQNGFRLFGKYYQGLWT